jgi:hypothetical protein
VRTTTSLRWAILVRTFSIASRPVAVWVEALTVRVVFLSSAFKSLWINGLLENATTTIVARIAILIPSFLPDTRMRSRQAACVALLAIY